MPSLSERITQLETELQRCQQQVQYWTAAQLRTEGALVVLKQMKEDDEKANSVPDSVPNDSAGTGGEPVSTSNVQ